MPRSLISLGANLGNVMETMRSAGRLLCDEFGGSALAFSHLYRTPAVGGPDGQSDFLNAVVTLESPLSCWEIWAAIQRVEAELGRQRMHRWEARRIDIDLLLHRDEKIWTPHLKVPHPRMCMRTFVLEPAIEVASDAIDPVTQWPLMHLAEHVRREVELPIVAVCNTRTLAAAIEAAMRERGDAESIRIHVEHCERPEALLALQRTSRMKLLVVCVETPDPETIQWEDYSNPWATALGLTPQASAFDLAGPRYLLPANDLRWTLHELISAHRAMSCPITRTDQGF